MLGILPHPVYRQLCGVEPFRDDLGAFSRFAFPLPAGEQPARHIPFGPGRKDELDDAGVGQVLLEHHDADLFPDLADHGLRVALPRFHVAADAHDLAGAEPGPFQAEQHFGAGARFAEQEAEGDGGRDHEFSL